MCEIWKNVVGYDNIYQVSNLGRVQRVMSSQGTTAGKILKPTIKNGYLCVNLYIDRRPTTKYVHRLVLEAFVGQCPPGMECCHRDDDRINANLSNLRWDTPMANAQDAMRNGRSILKGENVGTSKLTTAQVIEIKRLVHSNELSKTAIANMFGVSCETISAIAIGKSWKHIHGI